ncbi:MAG: hypothetical protein ACYTDU_07130 [Planctomycetota bacterium]
MVDGRATVARVGEKDEPVGDLDRLLDLRLDVLLSTSPMPPVSTSSIQRPSSSTRAATRSRVTPAMSSTIA